MRWTGNGVRSLSSSIDGGIDRRFQISSPAFLTVPAVHRPSSSVGDDWFSITLVADPAQLHCWLVIRLHRRQRN